LSAKPPRILVISEIPTPYRLPLYTRLHERPEVDLEIVFCAYAEPDRPWKLDAALGSLPHRVLRGVAPAIRTRRNTFVYQINPGIIGLLSDTRYDALVIGGYAVFAEQAAIAIARARGIPYLLHSESNLLKSRGRTKRFLKQAFVRPLVKGAAGALAAGSAAARYLEYYGMEPGRIRIVPNTIDVEQYRQQANAARSRASEVRTRWGLPDRYVFFAGRLMEVKGIIDLIEALALMDDVAPTLVVAGDGPLARDLPPAPAVMQFGFLQQDELIELLALADWTVVPSHLETWGVVVNEALAAGCPVIASDAVGAAEDLVVNGVNGRIFPARDSRALAIALASTPPGGDHSRGRIERWDYDLAVDQFVEALQLALPGRIPRLRS
jgi:glycosyltransferase involved in cell wall biosynthesis